MVSGLLIGGLFAYAVVLGGLYFAQGSLIYPAPEQAAPVPRGYRQIEVTTADGLKLAAVFLPPSPGRKTVVFFHGNGDSWDGAAAANRMIAGAGYGVLLAEYRGYGANLGKPGEQGFYADGRAVLAWLKTQGIGAEQTVLVGNSIGSGTATQLASETPVAGLAVISGFTSLPDVVAEKISWAPTRYLVRDKFDNHAKVGRITAPLLLLHGTADTMIGPEHAQALAQAQPKARLVLVPGFGHELAYQDASQQALLDWLVGL
ncbi:MAG: hypothetical protein RL299_2163 [Pseudomonadota bacterium]|jgi:fermentation-respiration switch protein FrsA (DUF1100 family)